MKDKVLLVDDEKELVDVIKINLEFEGYDVDVAYDGDEALKKLPQSKPDLIILDIMMTKVDGWEVLHQLRSSPEFNNTPVLILSAKIEESSKLLAFGLGAEDYVTKPFSTKELIARVRALLKRKETVKTEDVHKIPVVRGKSDILLLDQDDILYATPIQNYSYLHTMDKKYLTHFSLSELEKKLTGYFMRTHRSYIVNLHQVRAVISPSKGSYKIELKDENHTQLPVSRRKIKNIKSKLGI